MHKSKKYYRDKIQEIHNSHKFDFEKKIWDGKITEPVISQYKISLCTTCMNRAFDLKKTLPKNIEDNKDYPNLEFVVLDYNSQDDLEQWMKDNMMSHIESGRVVYYKTTTPKFYSMTKSRNLAFRLASGDTVNNVDADNYVHKGFAAYLNVLANQFTEKVIFSKGKRMLRGRLGFWKHEFMDELKGYNEKMEDYGRDDHDLLNRAWMAGYTLVQFGGDYYSNTGSKSHQMDSMKIKDWKLSELRNELQMLEGMAKGRIKGNRAEWGQDKVIKNFEEEICLI